MSLAQAVRVCLNKYVTFSGRARRSEFWWFALLFIGVSLIPSSQNPFAASRIEAALTFVGVLLSLALLLPFVAVSSRRLHDTGRSGWWLLLNLVPFGQLVLLVFYCQDGAPAANAHGPSPKSDTESY